MTREKLADHIMYVAAILTFTAMVTFKLWPLIVAAVILCVWCMIQTFDKGE